MVDGPTPARPSIIVPSAGPVITDDDIAAVVETLRSGVLANGPQAAKLEAAFSSFCDVAHTVSVSSGTDALSLAGQALGLRAGDVVLVAGYSFAATANAFLSLGCVVVPVDIDPVTFNVSDATLEEALAATPTAKAFVPVDLFGSTVGTDAAIERARAAGLLIIEDAAQAHGACDNTGARLGNRADATAFSLYATKNLSAGEGGLVTTADQRVVEAIKSLRNHGMVEQYEHRALGLNRRLPEMSAALAYAQLARLEQSNEWRRSFAATLDGWCAKAFGSVVQNPPEARTGSAAHVFHQFTVRCPDRAYRDALVDGMRERGVDVRVFYPYVIADLPGVTSRPTPIARTTSDTVCSIPVHPGLSAEQQAHLERSLVAVGAGLLA